ncbi:uncharacterized protein YdeI (YjbR/CyaY-like superfamily) [Chitinophaga skermanii]|uniref:Uncharacterized protein YdeI (YjbR/CyaY-like superfamily) n=1 Tax=Chitinophaga skermanii TaxID=331697 RepID=A0A327QVG3_9BACT|nr:DUF1801 domain-containing protein [Chitinophaga skermanii]RAJ08311.1 uncharacterized protein YdeI (YjbR/CyaY-like superfamily) [Chitinophaga skermanii]
MAKQHTDPQVDVFFAQLEQWQPELLELRKIVLSTPLTETYKWKQPCYTFNGNNVVIIGALKDVCVLSFFKGALLKDPEGVLTKAGENTQVSRTLKFKNVADIKALSSTIKAYIAEAIEIEQAGLKVVAKQDLSTIMPVEFEAVLAKDHDFKRAFEALTPGRQRAYLIHFSQAKQAQTRLARIEKYRPQILDGKGLMGF